MWIGDVGHFKYEEIDFQPANSPGGENYGWHRVEGAHCFDPPDSCGIEDYTLPFYEYTHTGRPLRCAIIGGYVYHGSIPGLQNRYIYGDFCSGHGRIYALSRAEGRAMDNYQLSAEFVGVPTDPGGLTSFGVDGNGELLFSVYTGEVYRIIRKDISIEWDQLVPGETTQFTMRGLYPTSAAFLFWGVREGLSYVPDLSVQLNIADERLIDSAKSDSTGTVTIPVAIPETAEGKSILLQAAEPGDASPLYRLTFP